MFHLDFRLRADLRADTAAAIVGLIAMLFFSTPAIATQVFHSPGDDGQPAAGAGSIAEGGVQSVYLYIDGGPTASEVDTACDTGSGSEVCGFTLSLTGLDDLTFAGFTPDENANLMHTLDALEFRVNGLDTAAPTPGPKRIGELVVNAVTGGSVELTAGEVVGADLSSEVLASSQIVAVPEPAALLQGMTCLGAIGFLLHRRGCP